MTTTEQNTIQTLTWHKFYAHRFTSVMTEHPNHIVGMWAKLWCNIANSPTRWTKKNSLDKWARIIGEDMKATKIFMNYIIDNFSEIVVRVFPGEQGKPTYEITDVWYEREERTRACNAKRATRHRQESPLVKTRDDLLKKITELYHPKRRVCQAVMARNEFLSIMRESSRNIKGQDAKIEHEKNVAAQIISYISFLEKTEEWDEEGKYLPGLGKFLKSRGWDYYDQSNYKESVSSGESIKDQLISDMVGR